MLSQMAPEPKSPPRSILVRACKFDGAEHRSWPAELIRQESALLVLDAKFEDEVRHDHLGTLLCGTRSLEYYWLDRWYSIFRFSEPTGELRNFYCNINLPPVLQGSVLSYIDLDIDVLVNPDLSFKILDEDEFTANALRYNYPVEVQAHARRALAELITLIEGRQFPFQDLR
jgi:protein associated with RNAse G/E